MKLTIAQGCTVNSIRKLERAATRHKSLFEVYAKRDISGIYTLGTDAMADFFLSKYENCLSKIEQLKTTLP